MFDVDERLRELSAKGDALERLSELVDFEVFRPDLERAVPRADGSKGGRPAFDHDGARLADLIDKENTARDVWGDTSYRSAKNEALLRQRHMVSRIHRKKPRGRPMASRTRKANARKSAVRSSVEHVFAYQKGPMGLLIRTIGMARARVKIGLANLAYNMRRYVWLSHRTAVV